MKVLFDFGPGASTATGSEFHGDFMAHLPGVVVDSFWASWVSPAVPYGSAGSVEPELLTSASLWSENPSPEALAWAASARTRADFYQVRFIALKMLNRVDFTGTFRFLEREVFFQQAVIKSAAVLCRSRPDLVVFRVTPHEFLQFVLMEVAKWMGIEVLHFQPCSIAPTMVPKLELGEALELSRSSVARSENMQEILQIASRQVQHLSDGRSPSYMVLQEGRDRAVESVSGRIASLRGLLRWLFVERFPSSQDFTGHRAPGGTLARALKIFLTKSLQSNLRASVAKLGRAFVTPEKFSVFALHYEPERTSLPDGLPFDSQADAILKARSLLSETETLVVKEHYSQQSSALRGFLGRSPASYSQIGQLPNTVFAPLSTNLRELVLHAERVFTLTGTIAIEAALRGIPVLYFGSPWWAGMPGTRRLGLESAFPEARGATPATVEEVAAFLHELIAVRMVPGLASESPAVIEKRLGQLPAAIQGLEAKALALCVQEWFSRRTTLMREASELTGG